MVIYGTSEIRGTNEHMEFPPQGAYFTDLD